MNGIKHLRITNCLGIKETELFPGKINIISGDNGKGKTSIIDSITKGLSNKNNREDFIHHGEDKATLFIELHDGTEVSRSITHKSESCKVTRNGMVASKTETYLKNLVNSFAFNPISFLEEDDKKQVATILNLINFDISKDDWRKWFPVPAQIDFTDHPLKIFKSYENQYYSARADVNSKIKLLTAQVEGAKQKLPEGFNAEEWRNAKISDAWDNVTQARDYNDKVTEAYSVIDNHSTQLKYIERNEETSLANAKTEYEQSCKDIQASQDRRRAEIQQGIDYNRSCIENQKALIAEYERKIQDCKNEIAIHKNRAEVLKESLTQIDDVLIANRLNDAKKGYEQLVGRIEDQISEMLKQENESNANAETYVKEHEPKDIEELIQKARDCEDMKGFVTQWDAMRVNEQTLKELKEEANAYTDLITLARTKPIELQKSLNLPIEGLTIDDNDKLCVNEMPIKNLSTGEQLKVAISIAKALSFDLKLICIDKYETLSPKNQTLLEETMKDDDYQYFITKVDDGEIHIESR